MGAPKQIIALEPIRVHLKVWGQVPILRLTSVHRHLVRHAPHCDPVVHSS